MTASPATGALSPEDLDTLDDLLDAMREDDPEVPEWEFCDGFLAALVCSRRAIAPEEYWPVLFEDFKPAEQMEFVWFWKRRWSEMEQALDADVKTLDDPRCFQPAVLDVRGAIAALPEAERAQMEADRRAAAQEGEPTDVPSYGQVWALGFMYAVENWPDEWAAPRDKEAAQWLDDALTAIVALTEDDAGKPAVSMYSEDGPPTVSDARLDAWGEAIWAVYDLRQLWKSMGPRVQSVRRAEAPGRNDPCPCGSGKKFKKCHGATS